tara:strand:+ start:358 stop:651 length:294 start_codon:yes stop_codon:yes gene_type:complete
VIFNESRIFYKKLLLFNILVLLAKFHTTYSYIDTEILIKKRIDYLKKRINKYPIKKIIIDPIVSLKVSLDFWGFLINIKIMLKNQKTAKKLHPINTA